MHKVWSGTEEMSYSFSRPSIQFQDHLEQKIVNLTQISLFVLLLSTFLSLSEDYHIDKEIMCSYPVYQNIWSNKMQNSPII